MRQIFGFLALALAALTTGYAAAPVDIANYRIEARLDAAQKSIAGHEIITWLNDSHDPVAELQFHLYLNAFKNGKTTFSRESSGVSRGFDASAESWGYVDIQKLLLVGGPDLTKSIQFIQPDDGNADDQTVIRVPLPTPVEPGATLQIEVSFLSKLPEVFARTGYHGDFVLAGQWFPKLGVWEKAGMRFVKRSQWNCHQFHATSEFYADFGSYDVTLTVPSSWVVGATGVQQSATVLAGNKTKQITFHQDHVHDFAWTASPLYVRQERIFHGNQEVSAAELSAVASKLGITSEEAKLGDVRMICLMQPEHADQMERHFKALRNAIKYFGLWYGPYPFQTITVVDPPWGAGGAGGMEYPTFITAGTDWIVSPKETNPEEVIVHEFGHQYWQGLVATNEFEEAFLDEGFNTYSTSRVLAKAYPPGAQSLRVLGIPISLLMTTMTGTFDNISRAAYLAVPKADSLARNSWQYDGILSYGVNSYTRVDVTLRTLEHYLGQQRMARIMRSYYQRWHFAHPAAPDFIESVQEGAGQDMKWFFDQFFYGSNLLDYSIENASSEPVEGFPGVFDRGGKRVTVSPDQAEKITDSSRNFRTEVTVRRNGEAVFPVDVLLLFENGQRIRRTWDGQYRWTKFELVTPSKLASAEVDPDHKILLDANLANNSYRMKTDLTVPVKWTSSVLFWVQNLLQSLAWLA